MKKKSAIKSWLNKKRDIDIKKFRCGDERVLGVVIGMSMSY